MARGAAVPRDMEEGAPDIWTSCEARDHTAKADDSGDDDVCEWERSQGKESSGLEVGVLFRS